MNNSNGKVLVFRIISIVFYVLAALLFFMRTSENSYMTYAIISLAVGAVFSSISAAISLKEKNAEEKSKSEKKENEQNGKNDD